jgi:hypothetical protein
LCPSATGVGDLDLDGYDDFCVGMGDYSNGETYEGAVFVMFGSASGVDTSKTKKIESNEAYSYFGTAISGNGDFNGDGIRDVAVGAPGYSNGEVSEGAIYAYQGEFGGLKTIPTILESDKEGAELGNDVDLVDVNGDSLSDVLAGAHKYKNTESNEGGAFVYTGATTGIAIAAAHLFLGTEKEAKLGTAVTGVGDVNGDGFQDFIITAPLASSSGTSSGAAFPLMGCNDCDYSSALLRESACGTFTSVGGTTYTSSGIYFDTLQNSSGLDSIVMIDLRIFPIDLSISGASTTISSNENSAEYQWLDCDNGYSEIAGATSQGFTPSADGNYAVIVTASNTCSDTSDCYAFILMGIDQHEMNWSIWPNPSSANLEVSFPNPITGELHIYDSQGKRVRTISFTQDSSLLVELPQAAGLYIIEVDQDGMRLSRKRIIKY